MLKNDLDVFMTVAFVQEELSVCLNTAPKEVLVFLGFPLTADPNRRRECLRSLEGTSQKPG